MKRIVLIFTALLTVVSCSTTRMLDSGQYRLQSNKIDIAGGAKISSSDISQYIKQQPNSYLLLNWNPFLYIYNWSDGSGKGVNRLLEKIGVPPVVFNPELVNSSTSNILNHLQYLGYYNSSVTSEISYRGQLASVTYHVRPGRRFPINKIVYDVPSGEFGDEFMADSADISIKKGSFLSEKALEAESVRGARYFRDKGYYSFSKNHYFFEADTLSGKNILYYRIKGYSRGESESGNAAIAKYHIKEVNISHSSDIPFREQLLRNINIIHPGDLYSEALVNKEYHRFSALKVFSNVSVEMTPADSAEVNCDINLGGSGVMGFKADLEASTNSSGLIGVSPQLSFYHKNIFHGGEWLNLGFTGNWQFMPKSDSAHSTELGVSASISFPKFLGLSLSRFKGQNIPRTEITTSFNYQNRPEYRRSIAGLSYGYTGQMGSRHFYQIYPLRINLVKLYSLSDSFTSTLVDNPYLWDSFKDHLDAGLSGVFYHITNSDIVPKTSYSYSRLMFDVSGNVISVFNRMLPQEGVFNEHMLMGLPYDQYVKLELSAGRTFRFGHDDGQAFALHVDIGAGKAYGNSSALPFEKQFYAGGANSMRGWQVRSLGPGSEKMNSSFIIPSQTGDLKFELDMEYRFRMFWKLEGALFAEAGNVWNFRDLSGISPETLAGDWGAGLRLNLDFILLRLDMGMKVYDPSLSEGQRWIGPPGWLKSDGYAIHFGVGYPF